MLVQDEGETQELCRWTVDLGTLPTFQQHANASNPSGFYTGEAELCVRRRELAYPRVLG